MPIIAKSAQISVTSAIFASLITLLQGPVEVRAQDMSKFIGDAELGKKVFKKCKACHQLGETAKNSTGPVLNGVIGRKAASFEGYGYGKSMRAAGKMGLVWDEKKIFNYIANPKKYLRAYLGKKKAKAKMKFKLKKEDDRRHVIAYLVGFSNSMAEVKTMPKAKMSKDSDAAMINAKLPSHMAEANQICVQNNYPKELLLTAEAKGGERKIKTLGQAGILCVAAGEEGKGTVGIFENEDALEGCSRLAIAGQTQVLIAYASFDNCAWKQ